MNGAREYANLLETGQYGRLYVVSGEHARGRTFRLFVLPQDVPAVPNGRNNAPLNPDAVEVYGVTGGNPGWTERYGWLHKGRWCEDLRELLAAARAVIESKYQQAIKTAAEDAAAAEARAAKLLDAY